MLLPNPSNTDAGELNERYFKVSRPFFLFLAASQLWVNGVDLILNTNWKAMLGDQIVMVDAAILTDPVELSIPPGRSEEVSSAATASDSSASSEGGNVTLLAIAVMVIGAVAFSIKLRMGLKQ